MAATVVLTNPVAAKHALRGYGGQFDCDLFTDSGQPGGCTDQQLEALTKLIKRLEPGHSRIFVPATVLDGPTATNPERAAVMKTIELAESAQANVNLTWWHGPYFENVAPQRKPCRKRSHGRFIGRELMAGFAGVIEEARAKHGPTCVTHATIQNEVNDNDIGLQCDVVESQEVYKRLYAALHQELARRDDPLGKEPSLRQAVDLVGGDLVAGGMSGVRNSEQRHWIAFMDSEMRSILDGYSIHVYWHPGDLASIDRRLTRLRGQIREHGIDLPIYVTEYGAKASGGEHDPGTVNGQNIEDTAQTGFEHAWFNALAPQYGCVGFAKWVLYRTDGPTRRFKQWGMICPPKESFKPLSPTYVVTWLFNHAVDQGWRAAGCWRSSDGMVLVSKFAAPADANHTLLALNRGPVVDLKLDKLLRPHVAYFRAIWNRHGEANGGRLHGEKRFPTDGSGTATVTVRHGEIVILSTRAIL